MISSNLQAQFYHSNIDQKDTTGLRCKAFHQWARHYLRRPALCAALLCVQCTAGCLGRTSKFRARAALARLHDRGALRSQGVQDRCLGSYLARES